MFLDDELKEIYEDYLAFVESNHFHDMANLWNETKRAVMARFEIPTHEHQIPKADYDTYPVRLKQIDNIWKLFRKQTDKYDLFEDDTFRKMLAEEYKNPWSRMRLFKKLGWEFIPMVLDSLILDVCYCGKSYRLHNIALGQHIPDTQLWSEEGVNLRLFVGGDEIDVNIYSPEHKKLQVKATLINDSEISFPKIEVLYVKPYKYLQK